MFLYKVHWREVFVSASAQSGLCFTNRGTSRKVHCFKATEKHSAISSPGAFLQQAWGDGPYCPHGLSAGGANQGFWQEETIMTCIPQLKRKCIGDAVLIGPVDRTPWAYVCEYKTNRFIFFFCHSYQEAKCLKRGWWFRHAVWGEVINIMSGKCFKSYSHSVVEAGPYLYLTPYAE